MTKAEIVDFVYGHVGGFSKKEATDLVDAVFDTMKETLAAGHKIKISGFGSFLVRDERQRRGLNPRTREKITLAPRRVVRFKPSPVLKEKVNQPAGASELGRSVIDGDARADGACADKG